MFEGSLVSIHEHVDDSRPPSWPRCGEVLMPARFGACSRSTGMQKNEMDFPACTSAEYGDCINGEGATRGETRAVDRHGTSGTVRGQAPEPSPSNPRRLRSTVVKVSSEDGGSNSWADSDWSWVPSI